MGSELYEQIYWEYNKRWFWRSKLVDIERVYIKIGGSRMHRAKIEDNSCHVTNKLISLHPDREKESYYNPLSIDECEYILKELGVRAESICYSFISHHPIDGYCHYIVYTLNYLDRIIALKFRSVEVGNKKITGYQFFKSFICISHGTKKDIMRERIHINRNNARDE